MDRLTPMSRIGTTESYQTGLMYVPVPDSTYFYVGFNNKYRNAGEAMHLGSGAVAISQFTPIRSLPIQDLPGLIAPAGACGRMVVDTTSAANNLGVVFRPAGIFLRTNTGMNVRLRPNADSTIWTSEEMWHITDTFAAQQIKATLYSGPEFSDDDPGVDIADWSEFVSGTSVPVVGGGSVIGADGWARIHTNNTGKNGAIEFVRANPDLHVHYDNNGFVGLQIPDQYPLLNETSVVVQQPRLVGGFDFSSWNTAADGSGTSYAPGAVLNLLEDTTTLYAQATYTGTIHVAISFIQDGKRYFMTHAGAVAPRFSRARWIDDWLNTWQGMANAENTDPHYVNTFKLKNDFAITIPAGEFSLDPQREMRHGAKDSLLFYENFAPDKEEYTGLYYTDPNVMLANNTWAGLFTSTNGWPDYSVADVQNTKLQSTHYLHRVNGVLTLSERSNSSAPFVKYNPTADQFEGVATADSATIFQLSRVRVADEHYVVIPDTTEAWSDEIIFDLHEAQQTQQQVWSKLIGKQMMTVSKIGNDTIYFHPNPNKVLTTAGELRLSANYRLTQTFTYIRDERAESLNTINEVDKPNMSATSDEFARLITGGMNSPMNVIYNGQYIDIVDTLRITLRPTGSGKIKDYYGRWRKGAPGLHIGANGTRYRDILVRTKTYHYSPVQTKLVLTPEHESYSFSPLRQQSRQLRFTLSKVTFRQLLDADGNLVREEVFDTEDKTSSLTLGPTACSFKNNHFSVSRAFADSITLVTVADNSHGINYDTLIISGLSLRIDGIDYPISARVPLMQTTLEGNELIWSVVGSDRNRYFIMAGSGGLIFRQFTNKISGGNPTLFKLGTGTNLIKGSSTPTNADGEYITPWRFDYHGADGQANQQLTLTTEYGVGMNFVINGSTPEASAASPSVLTYEYVDIFTNSNANFEEVVRLKYGADKWLKFELEGGTTPTLKLTTNHNEASIFSWGYLLLEYRLYNNGNYPTMTEVEFGYNSSTPVTVQTRYQANREYSMLLNNVLTYCGWVREDRLNNLTNSSLEWKTQDSVNLVHDKRFEGNASGLTAITNGNLQTTITPPGSSPTEIRYPAGTGPFVNIVDTLEVIISLQPEAPEYRFYDKWRNFTSLEDAHLKIPVTTRTYHSVPYDSLVCLVEDDKYSHVFSPSVPVDGETHTFVLYTEQRTGTRVLNVNNEPAVITPSASNDFTSRMELNNPAQAEIRLIDEYGNTPDWCEITAITAHSITVKCTKSGIRAPREAFIYLAYMVQDGSSRWRYINFRLSVSQPSHFVYANNQTLEHTRGASGDPLRNGMQQVHENKRILYYYNPSNEAQSTDQNVELPIRERGYYGWWRWYREGTGEIGDSDIPAEQWQQAPTNTGKYNYPFRIIGDSVWIDKNDTSKGKQLVTMGRYTVFHNPSSDYGAKTDPPAKAPQVYPPVGKAVVTYVADLSNYYDNLPLSMQHVNQIDTALLESAGQIVEPTLSLREVFELHPWTEMADTLDRYKYPYNAPTNADRYMEDHEVMAPLGNRLLLKTEHRYNYNNLKRGKHSESLLGYYMWDDNASNFVDERHDSLVWCGGWDVNCQWFTYNRRDSSYTPCSYSITEGDDFLNVPAKMVITAGQPADTVVYCLCARSKATTGAGTTESPDVTNDNGAYFFNICRYTIIYHDPAVYGPKVETNAGGVTKALITNDEIEQHYEVLERLNFDYNRPGSDYQVYPHPLPWADASYGYCYKQTPALPDNREHHKRFPSFPSMGEYSLINRIPYTDYWHPMQQHGGAENGYMIYCDGMSSAGQVAAISLSAKLCEGQKMYFSGYVANPSNQSGKANPNFLFSVQGSSNDTIWEDITSYMTGDMAPSDKWSQIFFPINQRGDFEHYRVRIYNMSNHFDGNDFIIDDLCIFATKPQLVAYQANTTCEPEAGNDSINHVVLRIDYQGFNNDSLNNKDLYYTIQCGEDNAPSFVIPMDGYINQATLPQPPKADIIYGGIRMPAKDFVPTSDIFDNLTDLTKRFDASLSAGPVYRQGYIYENLDGDVRPVLYVIHKAKMTPDNQYTVRMAPAPAELMSSICAMTSYLKISNRMALDLNGEEQPVNEAAGLCANTTYNLSLRVKGTLIQDNTAPIDINGSCMNDWLLYGDTAEATSLTRYGYRYRDIVKVVNILRCEPSSGTNLNQFAHNLAQVNRNEMLRIQEAESIGELTGKADPYTVLTNLVRNGHLILYRSNMVVTTTKDESVQYVIFPIVGTGSDAMLHMNVEVCPNPVFVKLTSDKGANVPIAVGGFNPDAEHTDEPATVFANAATANTELKIPIDTILGTVAIDSVLLLTTNDPNYLEGIHILRLMPDMDFATIASSDEYYKSGDTLRLTPASGNNYLMRQGYNYTFGLSCACVWDQM